MKPAQGLQTVTELATRQRDEALHALGQAQRELQQAEAQMRQLQSYVVESQKRWLERAGQGVTPTLLRHQQQFIAKLDHAIAFQGTVIDKLGQQLDSRRQRVTEAERELASLQKYAERQLQAWQQRAQRQEQKLNDEMAATVHRLQQNPTHAWRPS
jgi:flagellar FliJ protein